MSVMLASSALITTGVINEINCDLAMALLRSNVVMNCHSTLAVARSFVKLWLKGCNIVKPFI